MSAPSALSFLPTFFVNFWDTDYNSDNWEPEFMTIFVIWQLIVTLDSIRNSCDVFLRNLRYVTKYAFLCYSFGN